MLLLKWILLLSAGMSTSGAQPLALPPWSPQGTQPFVLGTFAAGVLAGAAFVYWQQRLVSRRTAEEQQQLANSNKLKDKLLSIIGHDLRGPMASVPVMLDICASDGCSTEERVYLLNAIRNNAVSALVTLDNLLRWGQRCTKYTMNKTQFNAYDTFLEDYQLVGSLAVIKGIELKNNVLPGLMVHADPNHFKFIMRNLLSNAIKFTQRGGVVEVNSDRHLMPGLIVFSVKDNGVGMDAQTKSTVFGSQGVSAVGTANETGTGIGLRLCSEFVSENDGAIWVDSEKERGSEFCFSLAEAKC